MSKTTILYNNHNLERNWPFSIYKKAVSSNSIYCHSCNRWVHKGCSGIKGKLKTDLYLKCNTCLCNINTASQFIPKFTIGIRISTQWTDFIIYEIPLATQQPFIVCFQYCLLQCLFLQCSFIC